MNIFLVSNVKMTRNIEVNKIMNIFLVSNVKMTRNIEFNKNDAYCSK